MNCGRLLFRAHLVVLAVVSGSAARGASSRKFGCMHERSSRLAAAWDSPPTLEMLSLLRIRIC